MKRRILLQRRGLLTATLAVLCLLTGLASGGREFFLVAALLLALLLLALAQAALQRPVLALVPEPGPALRGEAKPLALLAHNPHLWPLFPLRLSLSLLRQGQAPAELAHYELLLPGREKKILPIAAICPHRGEYQVMLPPYQAEDVFGFFAIPGRPLPPQSLLALPRLEETAFAPQQHPAHEDEESNLGRLGTQGQLSAESRLYQRGDALRAINWKKSASRRELFSRLHEYSADYSCCLLLDNRPYGQGKAAPEYQDRLSEEALEHKDRLCGAALEYEDRLCEAALSFLLAQLSQHQEFTLLPGGLHLRSAQGLSQAAELLAILPFNADTTAAALQSLLDNRQLPDALFLLLGQPPLGLTPLLEQLMERGCEVIYLAPAADAASLSTGLEPALPLISIDPPLMPAPGQEV